MEKVEKQYREELSETNKKTAEALKEISDLGNAGLERELQAELEQSIREYRQALETPFFKVLEQLEEKITQNGIKLIIGDDASGRLPAFALGKAINEMYDRTNSVHPPIRFVAGSTGMNASKYPTRTQEQARNKILYKYIEKSTRSLGADDVVLVVTEHIRTGKGLMPLVVALNKARTRNSFRVVIVAMGIGPKYIDENHVVSIEERVLELSNDFKSEVIYGEAGRGVTGHGLTGNYQLQGVLKKSTIPIFSERNFEFLGSSPYEAGEARKEMGEMAHAAVNRLKKKKKSASN